MKPRPFQTNSQIDRIMEAVTDALAENNATKKAFLNDPQFYCPYRDLERCFWKVHKVFSLLCLDPVRVSAKSTPLLDRVDIRDKLRTILISYAVAESSRSFVQKRIRTCLRSELARFA